MALLVDEIERDPRRVAVLERQREGPSFAVKGDLGEIDDGPPLVLADRTDQERRAERGRRPAMRRATSPGETRAARRE